VTPVAADAAGSRHVGRGLAALAGGVVLALASSVLVFALGDASPPPGHVLDGARLFVATAPSLTYRVTEVASSAATTAGEQTVRTRTVTGRERFAQGLDFIVHLGDLTEEFRSVAPTAGVWVRAAAPSGDLGRSPWLHAPSYGVFESAVSASGAGEAVLLDVMAGGGFVRSVLAGAKDPRRRGTSVRTIDVALDPGAVFGRERPAVRTASAVLTVDAHDRPTAMTVTVQSGTTALVSTYALVWDTAPAVSPPAPVDVVARL